MHPISSNSFFGHDRPSTSPRYILRCLLILLDLTRPSDPHHSCIN
jgi:hypothetical protein